MIKRLFDIVFSIFGLIISSPLFLIVAFLTKRESPGPVFYKGKRAGKGGKLFEMLKFRSMVQGADKLGGPSTPADDPRLLKIGRFLRRYKLDEIPQLLNVLKGEMSLVGPRPELSKYVKSYYRDYKEILRVKPGITDYASLEFKNENEMLNGLEDVEERYVNEILPVKIKYYKKYIKEKSIIKDFGLIFRTIFRIIK